MSPLDRKRLAAFEDFSATGTVDPSSIMGVVFRAALKANEGEAMQYASMSRKDAAEFRMNWLQKEYNKFKEERIYSKTWNITARDRRRRLG